MMMFLQFIRKKYVSNYFHENVQTRNTEIPKSSRNGWRPSDLRLNVLLHKYYKQISDVRKMEMSKI